MLERSSKTEIHPTAIIERGAEIGAGTRIGPYCVIGAGAQIGEDCVLHSHVVVTSATSIGAGCQIYPFASLGHPPQHLKYAGEKNRLVIGERNIIREHVTMNPGIEPEERITRVGSDSMYMIGSHVAHDCVVGDHVIFANNATIGGHCVIGDNVVLGGLAAVHQMSRIGRNAIVGGVSGVVTDVIPYGLVVGERARLAGLNIIGLKRSGFSRKDIHTMRKAYRMLFTEDGTFAERVEQVAKAFADSAPVQEIIEFVRAPAHRSLCLPRRAAED
jgi:UDP-N-acetylglucosamine acyltransferase